MFDSLKKMFDSQESAVEVHDVLVLVAFVVFICLSVYSVYRNGDFDARSYGEAVGIILGGGGFAAGGAALLRWMGKDR